VLSKIFKLFPIIRRKAKFFIHIPKRVFKKPSESNAVTSDLFPIRNDSEWSTEFEFLNVPGLINGDNSLKHSAAIYFFGADGVFLGQEVIDTNGNGRTTIQLDKFLIDERKLAATFAVFHDRPELAFDLEGSFIAERGYAGYKFRDMSVKGYVHGNLDAVALAGQKIQKLGNSGLLKKSYLVQHPLRGPATYDFVLTNPTNKRVRIRPYISSQSKSWERKKDLFISPMGCALFQFEVSAKEILKIKFESKLYLGRPVVFRKTDISMDVFHG